MKQLCFGKDNLPVVGPYQYETTEQLFHILPDLELLLTMWHQGTRHPRAVDIICNSEGLKDNDDLFCKSARLLRLVWREDDSFQQVLHFVRRVRKMLHHSILSRFLDTFPGHLVKNLPIEIWDRTQLPPKQFTVGHLYSNDKDLKRAKDAPHYLYNSVAFLYNFVFHRHFTDNSSKPRRLKCMSEHYEANVVLDRHFRGFQQYFSAAANQDLFDNDYDYAQTQPMDMA